MDSSHCHQPIYFEYEGHAKSFVSGFALLQCYVLSYIFLLQIFKVFPLYWNTFLVDSWPYFAWSFFYCKTLSLLQYRILVESASDCMTRWTRHLNDWPTWIKENCVQHLFRTYGSLGNTWAFLIFLLPLLIISPSLWLRHVHPGFINC